MAKTTERERRAAARAQRRSAKDDEPTIDESTDAVEGDPADALRAAASAAIAGAAVGAARAFARRRHADDDEDEEQIEEPPPAAESDEPEEQHEDAHEEEEEHERREPAPAGAAPRIVQRAREQLRELHGAEAESVSAIRRIADGWRVGLEVVEVHRVPESTDVLATYEVELDDDGQLLNFERTTRYYRSEADRR